MSERSGTTAALADTLLDYFDVRLKSGVDLSALD